jgi:hypothetical protein
MWQVSPKLWAGSEESADLVKIRKLTERITDAGVSDSGMLFFLHWRVRFNYFKSFLLHMGGPS